MSTSEAPVEESIEANLIGAAGEGAELVNISVDAEPVQVAEAINTFLTPQKTGWFRKPKLDPNIDYWTDRSLPIGSLWGHIMIQYFGWHWANLTQHDHDDFQVIAVVNEDRSLAIFPFHYCLGCLENHVQPTVLLAFNMLDTSKIPPQPAGSYTNLMDGVRHIVPPT